MPSIMTIVRKTVYNQFGRRSINFKTNFNSKYCINDLYIKNIINNKAQLQLSIKNKYASRKISYHNNCRYIDMV